MSIENPCVTSYLIAIVMQAIHFTVYEIFTVEKCIKCKYANRIYGFLFLFLGSSNVCRIYHQSKYALRWPWPLKLANVKCKYVNRKPIYDFIFDGNILLALSVTISDILVVKCVCVCVCVCVCMCVCVCLCVCGVILTLTIRMRQGQMWMCPYETLYSLVIEMFALSIAVCETITYKLPNIVVSNVIWPCELRSRTWRIWMKIPIHPLSTCICFAKIGVSNFCSLFPVAFRDVRTDARTYGSTYVHFLKWHNTVQLRWNGVKLESIKLENHNELNPFLFFSRDMFTHISPNNLITSVHTWLLTK